jgi:hypothetical protein
LAGNAPGDSVSVLGVVSSRSGQPTLDHAILARFGGRPAPLPVIINTQKAASANGGAFDAALVQVIAAEIKDTATVQPDFTVTINDGSGPLTVVLDANLNFVRSAFVKGRQTTIRGVLVPTGTGSWNLKPRDQGDVSVF